jgi:hypothetical protein
LELKNGNTLRIGFQNIGGVPLEAGKAKDNSIRTGITKFNFDIFGIACEYTDIPRALI